MAAIPTGADVRWRDPKRYLWTLGLVVPLLPFGAWNQHRDAGWHIAWWNGPIVIFVVIPLLDAVLRTDNRNPPESAFARLDADRYYRWLVYAYLPLQLAAYAFAAYVFVRNDLTWYDRLGLTITAGFVGGIAIANAHELGHKTNRTERWLAKLVLAQSAYGHFFVEHNRGHHARVATPEDPASSRLGESFWAFLPRTVVGSLRSAWRLETEFLAKRGLAPWTLRNEVLHAWLMSVVLFGATIAWLGVAAVPYIVGQAVFGFCLLEVVNYVEHYGLLRERRPDGRYERCRPEHSWNSNHVVSDVFLYHLERHSDHHAFPTRRYQCLRHFDDAPQLPSGYAGMVALAWCTPLWRRVMDHRVVAHYGGDVTRANVQPSQRARLLERYPQTSASAGS